MTQLRVGVVGLGGMGINHADNVVELGHEVVAGVDIDEEMQASFRDRYGAETFADHADMYDRASPDAVIITTPNKFHEPAAVDALDRDIAVLCEKPLSTTVDGAERIASAADRSDAICMVGFSNRFTGSAKLCTAYRDDGVFGDLTHIEARYLRRRGIPGTGTWFTTKELSGGGALIDLGVHAIDLALHLADFPDVEEVSAITRQNFGHRPDYHDPEGWGINEDGTFDVDDSVSAFLRCEDDLTISLDVSWAVNRPPSKEFALRGTEAGATFEMGSDPVTIYETGSGGMDHYRDVEVDGELDPSTHTAEDAYFLETVQEGTTLETNTVSEAVTVQRVIDAIYRSSEESAAISL